MKKVFIILLLYGISTAGCSQKNKENNASQKGELLVGGNCEGCEAIFECPVLFKDLVYTDTLPDFYDQGPRIEISGTVLHNDGKTPAADIIMYVYHTDQTGIYPKKGNETGWAKRHGYIRGWIKTDKNGIYKFYTLVPASYPQSKNPKHIHATIKEPGKSEYWIDDYFFAEDPFLQNENSSRPPRGGNGIINPVKDSDMLKATRNIILGLNIPGYPKPGS